MYDIYGSWYGNPCGHREPHALLAVALYAQLETLDRIRSSGWRALPEERRGRKEEQAECEDVSNAHV